MMKMAFSSFICFIVLLGLTACGFQPLHGDTQVEDSIEAIDISIIREEEGQILRNMLIDEINRGGYPDNPRYRLNVISLKKSAIGMGLDRESESNTRVQLLMTAPFELIDLRSNEKILRSSARGFVSYNVLESQFETIISQDDAVERALGLIARDIERQIYIALGQKVENGGL